MLSFLQQPVAAQSYAPQSGAIFGILKQMKEGFETNLADSTKEESDAAAGYAQMKAAKDEEIAAGNTQIQTKDTERADADDTAANAKTDLADTREALAADQEFLSNLRQKCQTFEQEYGMRQKTRTEEMAAVQEVITMLTGDDARDLFSRTYSFVQVVSKQRVSKRAQVSRLLMTAATKGKNPRMSALAMSAKLSGLETVKEKVQNMLDDLHAEKDSDKATYDQCVKELADNSADTATGKENADRLGTLIEDLSMSISNLNDEIKALNGEISATRVEMKRASEDREKENKEFQATVADQRATQAILNKALARLKQFYDKKAALVQSSTSEDQQLAARVASHRLLAKARQAPDGGYKKSAASGGVMMMIEGVIREAADLEKEAIKAEQDAQTAYEGFITDSNNSVDTKTKLIAEKTEESAENDQNKVIAERDANNQKKDLESLGGVASALHMDCDFLVNNWDIRTEARNQEIEALKNSMAILSGADFR